MDTLNNRLNLLNLEDHGKESPLDIKKKILGDIG